MTREAFKDRYELDVLLEHARRVPPVPDVVRARGMARARATIAAIASATTTERPAAAIAPIRRFRLAVAASLALAVGAAGAMAALRGWTPHNRQLPPSHSELAPSPATRLQSPARHETVDTTAPGERLLRRSRTAAPAPHDLYAGELDLLQRAQAAYVGRDFAGALVLLTEHARRFPSGRLAEEREAIRVQSLTRAGRPDEARRAADAFATRFPRSVLLPRLKKSSDARE
jgi:hypothetical protein